MDNNTRKLLGLIAKAFIPDEDWLFKGIFVSVCFPCNE